MGGNGPTGGAGAASNMLNVCFGRDAGCRSGNKIRQHTMLPLQIAATPENQPLRVRILPPDSINASSNIARPVSARFA
jgi:hypothetical protein